MSAPRRPAGRPSRRPARTGARTTAPRASSSTSTAAPVGKPPKPPRSRPSNQLTARAVILALVVITLLVSAALPLREFLAQRGEIADLEQAQAQAQERVEALEAERLRLQDPAYVKAEARRRLRFVLPGETAYVLLQPEPEPDAGAANSKRIGGAAGPEAPWYSQLWGSVDAADRSAK